MTDHRRSSDHSFGRMQPVREPVDGGIEIAPAALELGDITVARLPVPNRQVAERVDLLWVDLHGLPVGADQHQLRSSLQRERGEQLVREVVALWRQAQVSAADLATVSVERDQVEVVHLRVRPFERESELDLRGFVQDGQPMGQEEETALLQLLEEGSPLRAEVWGWVLDLGHGHLVVAGQVRTSLPTAFVEREPVRGAVPLVPISPIRRCPFAVAIPFQSELVDGLRGVRMERPLVIPLRPAHGGTAVRHVVVVVGNGEDDAPRVALAQGDA